MELGHKPGPAMCWYCCSWLPHSLPLGDVLLIPILILDVVAELKWVEQRKGKVRCNVGRPLGETHWRILPGPAQR